jgi:ribonuclease HI
MQLAKRNEVKLIWVPGHEGFDGNKMADQLTKLGSA